MEITETRSNAVVIVAVTGRLDATNAHAFEERVLGLIEAGEMRLVVDCAQLDYISSAGLRVLLVAAKRLNATGGKIVVAALNDQIQQIFDIAGFSSMFQVYATRDDAVAAVR